MFEKFDFWQDAKDNWANRQKDKMRNLLLKYGGVLDEDEMDDAGWFEYQAAKNMKARFAGKRLVRFLTINCLQFFR